MKIRYIGAVRDPRADAWLAEHIDVLAGLELDVWIQPMDNGPLLHVGTRGRIPAMTASRIAAVLSDRYAVVVHRSSSPRFEGTQIRLDRIYPDGRRGRPDSLAVDVVLSAESGCTCAPVLVGTAAAS